MIEIPIGIALAIITIILIQAIRAYFSGDL